MFFSRGPGSDPYRGGLRNAFVFDDVIARLFGRDAPTRARNAFLHAVSGQPPVPQASLELAQIATMRCP